MSSLLRLSAGHEEVAQAEGTKKARRWKLRCYALLRCYTIDTRGAHAHARRAAHTQAARL
jgi:hypothetical protein